MKDLTFTADGVRDILADFDPTQAEYAVDHGTIANAGLTPFPRYRQAVRELFGHVTAMAKNQEERERLLEEGEWRPVAEARYQHLQASLLRLCYRYFVWARALRPLLGAEELTPQRMYELDRHEAYAQALMTFDPQRGGFKFHNDVRVRDRLRALGDPQGNPEQQAAFSKALNAEVQAIGAETAKVSDLPLGDCGASFTVERMLANANALIAMGENASMVADAPKPSLEVKA